MPYQPFDDLTDVYETLVNWPKRLAREGPFYRQLFADHNVRRVADVACGTGHHAAMFHEWNLQVEGSDLSPVMIARARERFGEPRGLQWAVRGFETTPQADPPFDAVICVGNSLALAADDHTMQIAVHRMLRAVRPGGIVVVHVLNLWSLPDGPCIWQKCVQLERSGNLTLVTKGIHRCGHRGFVDLVVGSVAPPALLTTQSVPLQGLTVDQFDTWTADAGATRIHCFGDYQQATYVQATSPDLIAVLQRHES